MHVYLETERLILRRFTEADVDNLFDLDSDPEVMRYLNGGTPTPREVVETEILPAFLGYYEWGDGYGFWAAVEKSSDDFLGWFHLRPSKGARPDEPELGYRLRKATWGRGLGTEGARELIRKAFAELGASRVVASTYQDNLGSRRVMEKSGMTLVRTYRSTPEQAAAQDTYTADSNDYWDGEEVEYAIERAEWERQGAGR